MDYDGKGRANFTIPIESKEELMRMLKATDFIGALWELDQHLRNAVKYAEESVSPEALAEREKLREKLYEILDEHNIDFEELYT